jgi:hypothetical protein
MPDRPLTGKALRKLFREWTHDYGLRRMEDRGLKYEDEKNRPLDRALDRQATRPAPTTPDAARRAQFQQRDEAKSLDR